MFDNLHSAMTRVRSEMMGSINEMLDTKLSVLESRVRDCSQDNVNNNVNNNANNNAIENIKLELHRYVHSELNSVTIALMNSMREQLEVFKINILSQLDNIRNSLPKNEPFVCSPSISNNLVVERKDESSIMMCEEEDVEVEAEVEEAEADTEVEEAEVEDEEVEAEVEEAEVDVEEENKFRPIEHGDKTYWVDKNFVVYKETDEGYEEIGTYDTETGNLDIEDADEENAIETTEFTYKGKTYYRDEDNNVYNEDSEEIGIWTGTVVKFIVKKSA